MIIPRHFSLFGRLVDLANIDCHWFAFDATVWIYYLSWLGLWLGMPWWPCCCEAPEPAQCEFCSTGRTPLEYQLDIPEGHWTGQSCTNDDCAAAEGTFVLLQGSVSTSNPCFWEVKLSTYDTCVDPDVPDCCFRWLQVQITPVGTVAVSVRRDGAAVSDSHIVIWQETLSNLGSPECDEIDDDIPFCTNSSLQVGEKACLWDGDSTNLGPCRPADGTAVHLTAL
jgi:hypothetical protein